MTIAERGIYRIDRSFVEQNTLFDVNSIDPRTLRIFGNGAGMLPQPISVSRAEDLVENAIYAVGFEDGSFDASDYALFYAQGPDNYQVTDGHFAYEKHLYSESNYYFLTMGGQTGLRMQEMEQVQGSGRVITTYNDLFVHELDEVNILKNAQRRGGSGREWYGEIFQLNVNLEEDYLFPATGFTGQAEVIVSTLGQICRSKLYGGTGQWRIDWAARPGENSTDRSRSIQGPRIREQRHFFSQYCACI